MTTGKYWSEHRDLVFNQIKELQKRIEELEAPKSCADCVEATQLNMAFCDCNYFGKVKVNHYCSFFQPKDKNDKR